MSSFAISAGTKPRNDQGGPADEEFDSNLSYSMSQQTQQNAGIDAASRQRLSSNLVRGRQAHRKSSRLDSQQQSLKDESDARSGLIFTSGAMMNDNWLDEDINLAQKEFVELSGKSSKHGRKQLDRGQRRRREFYESSPLKVLTQDEQLNN